RWSSRHCGGSSAQPAKRMAAAMQSLALARLHCEWPAVWRRYTLCRTGMFYPSNRQEGTKSHRHCPPLMRAPDPCRFQIVAGDDPHTFIQSRDDICWRAAFQKRDGVATAGSKHALARLGHLGRIGIALQRGIAEGEAQVT